MTKRVGFDELILILFTLFVVAANAWYNTTLPIYIDEAYYWLWGENPALSYFDHPPMVAYMIGLSTIFSEDVFFVRLPAVLSVIGAAYFIYRLALRIYSRDVANLSVFLFFISPVVGMGFTIVTPDSPLILFWSAALWFSYKAIFDGNRNDYIYAGIVIGLGLLSKYTMVLFFGFLLLFLIAKRPKIFLSYKPWMAVGIALLLFTPVVLWNWMHEWISFTFQYDHATGEEFKILWNKFFEFFGGQFLLMSPVFFAVLLFAVIRYGVYFKDEKRFFVALSFLFPILFILYKALFKKMELNWGVVAYIGAVMVVAEWFIVSKKHNLIAFGSLLSVIIVLVMKFPLAFGLEGKQNPQNRIFGYHEAYLYVKPMLKEGDVILSDHLTRAAIFTYYDGKRAYIPTPARISQFDIWDKDVDFASLHGIYLSKDERLEDLKKIYQNVEQLEDFVAHRDGYESRRFYIYRVSNPTKG